jgi:bifunctional DNA-binding transcriptional regulator/antitoxin component of YhaV-PrlF toxin-antitoxin module
MLVVPWHVSSHHLGYHPTMAVTLLPEASEIVNLRAKNQLTLPEALARQVDATPGDRFRAWVEPDGTIVLRKCVSLAGMYPGLWGDSDAETAAHLRELRDEWERDRPWY